ncbi:MAG: C39 family peptidase [Paraclostridium bifermentans]|uniref:C39 family peptidase n=1 Tax=Paraclostridium bifermentans TaxID=1490 RepID=UPI001DA7B38A|nr:C39 family peptidase [Paraclostridium bifermentans]MBS6507961.1 C39 family peptidase [Paraclostridium bifermentans]
MNFNIFVYQKKIKVISCVILTIVVLGLLYIAFLKLNTNKHSSISKDEIVTKLEDLSHSDPKINEILNNIDRYPDKYLELLSKNIETINFVLNYPNHTSKSNSKKASIEEYYTPGEIPLFLQWDKNWGYDMYGEDPIAIDGCAPTSLAMVAVGLTGNTSVTPLSVSDYAYKNGYYIDGVGSSWSLISEGSKHFGLKSHELPLNKSSILSTLESGNPIILTVGPGTFTSTGHFLVLTGLTDDGKIKINDPNSKLNSSKSWDVDIFLNETKNLWKISKL